MELAEDLKNLLAEFSAISLASQELVTENMRMKKMMEEKEQQLQESAAMTTRLEKDLQRKQNMLEMIHQQLSVIPELKMKVEELTSSVVMLEKMSMSKDQELTRLQQKHLGDLSSLKGEIEKERKDCREEEKKRMEEMEMFFKQAHETELTSMEKKCEREKQVVVDELRIMEDELRKVRAQHEEELEMLRVQIVSAKGKASQGPPSNSEIYRKKMIAMQEHYEKQIQEILSKDQFKEGVACASTPESTRKKKKVSFVLPETSNEDDEIPESDIFPREAEDTTEKKFESIFAVAANKFSRAKRNVLGSSGKRNYDMMVNTVGEEEGRKSGKQHEGSIQSLPTVTNYKDKVQNRFRFTFNNISSTMSGSATEFGKFSSIAGYGGDSNESAGKACDEGVGRPGHGQQAGTGGMKRKLFSEGAGPQLLD